MLVINPPTPTDDPPPTLQVAVSIPLPPPNPPDLVVQALAALYARNEAIDQELTALDVRK
jgi:hypothetical protein